MPRELRISDTLSSHLAELSVDEQEEVLEILELLREIEDLDALIDDTEVRAPLVFHYTLGESVAVTWSRAAGDSVIVAACDRYRAPPADMA